MFSQQWPKASGRRQWSGYGEDFEMPEQEASGFLAGTYDERMYEELRLRSQTFEVLTGGDFAADHADGQDDIPESQGKELGLSVLPLPPKMIDDLRVRLQVWEPDETL